MLESYRLKLVRPACDPAAVTMGVIAEFDEDASPVMPYLNAVLKGCRYDPGALHLRFRHGPYTITLHRSHLTLTRVADETEAHTAVRDVAQLVTQTGARRGTIEPSHRRGTEVSALEAYKHLPRTNCGRCGKPTCLAFAASLSSGETGPEDCPPLAEPVDGDSLEQAARLRQLFGME